MLSRSSVRDPVSGFNSNCDPVNKLWTLDIGKDEGGRMKAENGRLTMETKNLKPETPDEKRGSRWS
jgi:hypothetical protein